jgi:hypothetical protein
MKSLGRDSSRSYLGRSVSVPVSKHLRLNGRSDQSNLACAHRRGFKWDGGNLTGITIAKTTENSRQGLTPGISQNRHPNMAQYHSASRWIPCALHRSDDGPHQLPRYADAQLDLWCHVLVSCSAMIASHVGLLPSRSARTREPRCRLSIIRQSTSR